MALRFSNLDPAQRQYAASVHESGHAAGCWAQGVGIRRLTVVPCAASAGACHHEHCDSRRYAIILACGPLAERRLGWTADGGDMWGTDRWGRSAVGSDSERFGWHAQLAQAADGRWWDRLYSLKLQNEAAQLVVQHWPAIERLAAELYRRESLTGTEAERILRGG